MSETPFRTAVITTLNELCSELAAAPDANPSHIAETVCRHYLALTDSDYCRIWWINTAETEARVLAHVPATQFTEPWQHIKSLTDDATTIVSQVIKTRLPRIEPDAQNATNVEGRYGSVYQVLSGCHVPIVIGGTSRGDMVFCSKREKNHYLAEDLDVYQALAAFAGYALSGFIGDAAFGDAAARAS